MTSSLAVEVYAYCSPASVALQCFSNLSRDLRWRPARRLCWATTQTGTKMVLVEQAFLTCDMVRAIAFALTACRIVVEQPAEASSPSSYQPSFMLSLLSSLVSPSSGPLTSSTLSVDLSDSMMNSIRNRRRNGAFEFRTTAPCHFHCHFPRPKMRLSLGSGSAIASHSLVASAI